MKLTIMKPAEVEIATMRVNVAVRYEDSDIPYDFPFRKGDMWDVSIDVGTGKIKGWPAGFAFDVYMKVCDQGNYYLFDADGNEVASKESDYVPGCVPGDYGDYIDFKIDGEGRIAGWSHRFTAEAVREAFRFRDDDE